MSNTLGQYLRARREQVDPADVGLSVTGVRRTPGLRREEVATLAGISADYYLRLEQGRDRNPSPQVLEALARVFGLDEVATAYLLSLIAPRAAGARKPRLETVPIGIRHLLGSLDLPAFVESRSFDILAANALATALDATVVVGANRLRSAFLDPAMRIIHPDLTKALPGMVGSFRTSIGPADLTDPRVTQLIGELSLASEEFRKLWARHDVTPLSGARLRLVHPEIGEIAVRREKLPIGDTDGQVLAIFHPEPGTVAVAAFDRLRALASSDTTVTA